jgi:hypothetical protein
MIWMWSPRFSVETFSDAKRFGVARGTAVGAGRANTLGASSPCSRNRCSSSESGVSRSAAMRCVSLKTGVVQSTLSRTSAAGRYINASICKAWGFSAPSFGTRDHSAALSGSSAHMSRNRCMNQK